MDDTTLALILTLLATAGFGGLIALSWRLERCAAEGRQALARRRGLMFDTIAPQRGRAGRYVFTDTARGMVLEIIRRRSSKGSSHDGGCALRLSQPRLQEGLAIWVHGMPGGLGAQLQQLGGMLELGPVQALLRRVLGDDIAPQLPHLREVPLPDVPGLTLLTNADPARLPPAGPILAALEALPERNGRPVFAYLDAGGLTLRLTKAITNPAGIEALLDAGLALHRALR